MRRALHANLSAEAHEGWETFCADQGVTLTALLEVIGLALAQGRAVPNNAAYAQTPEFRGIIAEARRLTAESRKRRR